MNKLTKKISRNSLIARSRHLSLYIFVLQIGLLINVHVSSISVINESMRKEGKNVLKNWFYAEKQCCEKFFSKNSFSNCFYWIEHNLYRVVLFWWKGYVCDDIINWCFWSKWDHPNMWTTGWNKCILVNQATEVINLLY